MTHPYQISVWLYTSIPDGYAGQTPALPVLQTNAPTWATVNNRSGYDIQIGLREDTEYTFEIFVNYRADFVWQRNMFIIVPEFGAIDIRGINEDKRKRLMRLDGVLVAGSSAAGVGPLPGVTSGVYFINAIPEPGASSVVIPQVANGEPLAFARDGIGRAILLGEVPTSPSYVNYVGGGQFDLMPGDIFGVEVVTVLYKIL